MAHSKNGSERSSWPPVEPHPWTKRSRRKFAKKEMLLAKNLATVKAAYDIASEWAEKNKIELRVGNPAVAA